MVDLLMILYLNLSLLIIYWFNIFYLIVVSLVGVIQALASAHIV